MYKQIILSKIHEYCKKINHPVKKAGQVVMLACPYCGGEEHSANVIPNTNIINCLKCRKKFDLIQLVNEVEFQNFSEEEALEHVKALLKLDVQTKKDEEKVSKRLDQYEKRNFCMVPCAKKDKNPIQKGWTDKENRNKEEWAQWIINGLNIGVRTGSVSGITVIDLDFLTKAEKVELVKEGTPKKRIEEILKKKQDAFEKVKPLIGNPWIQETQGGYHLFYKYTNLPKTRVKMDDYYIDLENDGGLVVVAPAPETAVYEEYVENEVKRKKIVGYASRDFINDVEIPSMPKELEDLLVENAPTQTYEEGQSIAEEKANHESEVVRLELLDDGDGRNSFFTSLGGYLLHRLSPDQVEYTLHGLNGRICKTPLESKEIRAMLRSLERYDDIYQSRMETEIMDYLKLAETFVTKTDIEIAVLNTRAKGEEKKKIDETLVKLVKDRKIIQKGRQYKSLKEMEWTDTITDIGVPIDFKVPYFDDYAHFNWGDLIIVGALTKVGKTTIAMNIVKRLVDQGIKPYYIYSENGARFKNKALKLGMKDGDFFKVYCDKVDEVQFKKGHHVTVWDWIDVEDFAKTNVVFSNISKKIEEAQGIVIAFVQLREDNKNNEPEWFAKNLIKQYPALAVKYLYESSDGQYGKFKLCEIRDPKVRGKEFEIPAVYIPKTDEVVRLDELEAEEQQVKESGTD